MTEILLFTGLVAICFLSGWWSRRSALGGLLWAGVGPMVIVVFWWIFHFASLATVEMLGRVFGIGFDWVESLPNLVRVCLNPPTVLTLIGFILFIRYERINHAPPPVGFTDARGKGYGGYRASSLHMKNLPTVRTFRY